MSGGSLEERVTRLETQVEDLEEEEKNTRKRLHELEGLKYITRTLAETIKEMPQQFKDIANESANTAIELANKQQETRHNRVVGIRLQLGSLVIGALGLGVLIDQVIPK